MEIISAIILGLIQGLTEFLPVSSSGHLIIFREILNLNNEGGLAFDAILQLATTFAILIYFRKDLVDYFKTIILFIKIKILRKQIESIETLNKNLPIIKFIIIATIPAVIFGLLLEDYMESVFRNYNLVAVTLIIGSVIMFLADKYAKQNFEINSKNSFKIGFFQALALIPGMSRSGMTISGGLLSGLKREEAIKFSFLIAIPILIGTGAKKLLDLFQTNSLLHSEFGISLLVASVVAFLSGLFAIHFLISYLKNNNFNKFIIYRIFVALVLIIFF